MTEEALIVESADSPDSVLPPTPTEPTLEEKEAAWKEARDLLETDVVINRAFHAVVSARYLHQAAMTEMFKATAKKAISPLVDAVLRSASIVESENPENYNQIRDRAIKIVVPFIVETAGAYDEEEKKHLANERRTEEEQRKTRPVVLGDLIVDRARPVVVPVFGRPLFNLLIDQILLSLPEPHDLRIVRLTTAKAVPDAARRSIELPLKQFYGCADSAEKFQNVIVDLIQKRIGLPTIDLLIVDDLLKLGDAPIAGMGEARWAAAVQKNMRKGLREVNAALLCGFQCNEAVSTDPKDSAWGPLASYTRILPPVVTAPVEDIRVVTCGPLTFRIESEVWDAAHGMGLIKPL